MRVIFNILIVLVVAYLGYVGWGMVRNIKHPPEPLPHVPPAEVASGRDTSSGEQSLPQAGVLSEHVDLPMTKITVTGSAPEKTTMVDVFVTSSDPEFLEGETYDVIYGGLDYGRGRIWVKEDGTYSGTIEVPEGAWAVYLFNPETKELLEKRIVTVVIEGS